MADTPQPVDFDSRPPMPVSEYEQTARRVNIGYDLLFTLVGCFLRSLRQPALNLLVVGAGGGMEIERFLPDNPGWRLTGVDPSRDMLSLAQAKADHLGVRERVTLIQGTVDDLPADAHFDAATCMFVLHFLPDEGKNSLLRGIATRLRPDAPVVVASSIRGDDGGLRDDLLGIWQHYGELMGMPAERMASTIERLVAQASTLATAEQYEQLLREAGFERVARIFSASPGFSGWLAR
ncbi:MAG TPA: class I SAM-dependent methyltransferase [Ktedonobacterales bacterium]|nr:class I SAM-dependent methyltransferase [Ktedonobacterales bacterium]